MKGAVGVPVAGGHPDTFVRERASATPTRRRQQPSHAKGPQRAAQTRPVRAPLRALQEWFAAAVMHPVSVAASVDETKTLGDETIGASDVERVVRPSSRLSGIERIEIYHDAYRARLVECLADDYPALRNALGEPRFDALCQAYVAEHPSRSPNLNFFGRHMSRFCRTRRDSVPAWSGDLAALEWAMVEVIHAAPVESPSEETLAKIAPADWPRARFSSSDAVRVLEFEYAVNAYFQAYNTGADAELPERAWSATAVFRDGATIWRMDMSRPMHALLAALLGGAPLGEALDALAASGAVGEDEAPLVMGWFRDWVKYGFFASIVASS
jgi:hypothetical protein